MLADQLIERNSIFLRNINKNATQDKDVWVSGTGYGFYSIPYEVPLVLNHKYYLRCVYKFTTTNQSPTWCTMYFQGGGGGGGPSRSNPVANTEYIISGIRTPYITNGSAPITGGTMYNGNSGAISGVTSYVKNILVYDVTELYYALLAKGTITNDDTLTTWCNNNLDYKKAKENYDITSLVADSTTNKVVIKQGAVVANSFVEPDGMKFYSFSSNMRTHTWYDDGSATPVYNNAGGGTVVHTRIDADTVGSPFYPEHKKVLQITTDGTASPGQGGFYTCHSAGASKIFIEKFVAKLPKNHYLVCHYNSQGTGASVGFISSIRGTGDWEEYSVLYKCGASGSFSTGGHISIYADNTGKNLLKYGLYSDLWTTRDYQSRTNTTIKNEKIHVDANSDTSIDTGVQVYLNNYITLPANSTIRLSYDIRSNGININAAGTSSWYNRLVDSSGTSIYMNSSISFTADGKWHRVTSTFTTNSNTSYQLWLSTEENLYGTGKYYEIKDVMLSTSSDTSYVPYDKTDYVRWFVAYCNDCDITGKEYLKNYTVLPYKVGMKAGVVTSKEFNTRNLLSNGDCLRQEQNLLPSGWYYDADDVAGSGHASIVQPVNAGSGVYNSFVNINPTERYKLSLWIKCKADMTSFLMPIYYYVGNTILYHTIVVYVPNTKTTLKEALVSGATTVKVASNSNWVARSYSALGFRSGSTWSTTTYNDLGTRSNGSTGMVDSISGSDTINLKTAYTGSTMPAGTVIVESFSGGTYPYPIGKGNLPTDNTWKYVEGYFGADNLIWEGSGTEWAGIPAQARGLKLGLNLYTNNGTVPIKYCDIKIEPVSSGGGHRYEDKVQIKIK